jgi:hypothetical protein
MTNPFRLRWLEGWTFQVVLMEGHVQVEAQGFGITLRTPVLPQETPQMAADRLVLDEDRRRRSLRQAWLGAKIPSPPIRRCVTQTLIRRKSSYIPRGCW